VVKLKVAINTQLEREAQKYVYHKNKNKKFILTAIYIGLQKYCKSIKKLQYMAKTSSSPLKTLINS